MSRSVAAGSSDRIAERVVDRLEDRHRRVDTDEVEQRERAHREVAAALHRRVDRLDRRRAALEHSHRVVEVREQQGVDDEAGVILHLDSVLAARRDECHRRVRSSRQHAVSGRTTSTSFIRGAGLKKWMPQTCSGRDVASARSITGNVDVLVARIADGFVARSSSPNNADLDRRAPRSPTRSRDRSQPNPASPSVAVMRPITVSRWTSAVVLPRSTAFDRSGVDRLQHGIRGCLRPRGHDHVVAGAGDHLGEPGTHDPRADDAHGADGSMPCAEL